MVTPSTATANRLQQLSYSERALVCRAAFVWTPLAGYAETEHPERHTPERCDRAVCLSAGPDYTVSEKSFKERRYYLTRITL
jgi:hypothetical protein